MKGLAGRGGWVGTEYACGWLENMGACTWMVGLRVCYLGLQGCTVCGLFYWDVAWLRGLAWICRVPWGNALLLWMYVLLSPMKLLPYASII